MFGLSREGDKRLLIGPATDPARCCDSARVALDSEPDVSLVTCEASRGWLLFQCGGLFVSVSGGLVMLVAAAAAHGAASIPLTTIGGAWLLIGLLGTRQYRRTVRRMTFDGVLMRFSLIMGMSTSSRFPTSASSSGRVTTSIGWVRSAP